MPSLSSLTMFYLHNRGRSRIAVPAISAMQPAPQGATNIHCSVPSPHCDNNSQYRVTDTSTPPPPPPYRRHTSRSLTLDAIDKTKPTRRVTATSEAKGAASPLMSQTTKGGGCVRMTHMAQAKHKHIHMPNTCQTHTIVAARCGTASCTGRRRG